MHQNIRLMDMYVRMYDKMKKRPTDGQTNYSVLNDSDRLFASKHLIHARRGIPPRRDRGTEGDLLRRTPGREKGLKNVKTDGVPEQTGARPSLVSTLRRHHRLDVPEPAGHVPAQVGQGQDPHVGPAVACLDYQSRGIHCIQPPPLGMELVLNTKP